MAKARAVEVGQLIEALNAIGVGDVQAIDLKLESAQSTLDRLGLSELSETIGEARKSLSVCDLAGFRRLVAQTVSRLGHVR